MAWLVRAGPARDDAEWGPVSVGPYPEMIVVLAGMVVVVLLVAVFVLGDAVPTHSTTRTNGTNRLRGYGRRAIRKWSLSQGRRILYAAMVSGRIRSWERMIEPGRVVRFTTETMWSTMVWPWP